MNEDKITIMEKKFDTTGLAIRGLNFIPGIIVGLRTEKIKLHRNMRRIKKLYRKLVILNQKINSEGESNE